MVDGLNRAQPRRAASPDRRRFHARSDLDIRRAGRVGLKRAATRPGSEARFEAKGRDYHERVREGFLGDRRRRAAAMRGYRCQSAMSTPLLPRRLTRYASGCGLWTWPTTTISRPTMPARERGSPEAPSPRENTLLLGHEAAEASAAPSLQRRPAVPCLADHRAARHRQGDVVLSLCAVFSSPRERPGAAGACPPATSLAVAPSQAFRLSHGAIPIC